MEMPVAEDSFDLDLYPKFDEISEYIEKQREKRINDKKTYTRGSTVLAFNPDTLQQVGLRWLFYVHLPKQYVLIFNTRWIQL